MKRLFDIVASAGALVVFALPLLVLILLIRRNSPGPGLFRQIRVGRNEKPFTCYKLRTMRTGTREAPTHQSSTGDVTPMGGWLRRSKLDEIPQLWNVLVGEMSLVGPRPCLPSQTELIAARRRRGVYALRPGITGIAQTAGVDMSDPEKLAALDASYIGKENLRTDLQILYGTFSSKALADRVAHTDHNAR